MGSLRVDPDLWVMLSAVCSGARRLQVREVMTEAGERPEESALLVDGLMGRYVRGASETGTQRAIVSISVPGDFVDLHGLPLKRLDHDVGALTDVQVALFPLGAKPDHGRVQPARKATLAIDHDRRLDPPALDLPGSRLRALAAVADFVSEMDMRLRDAGEIEGDRLPLPLLQTDIAEIVGLSPVHVSRVCKELRESGACTIRDGYAEIHDRARLHRLAQFDPSYLYPPDD